MIWHRTPAKPLRPYSAVLVRPPSSKHVILPTRRLAAANNGPFNQQAPLATSMQWVFRQVGPDPEAGGGGLSGVRGREEQGEDGKRR